MTDNDDAYRLQVIHNIARHMMKISTLMDEISNELEHVMAIEEEHSLSDDWLVSVITAQARSLVDQMRTQSAEISTAFRPLLQEEEQ